MDQEHIWNLIAKKLSGELLPDELHELEILLRKNPELHYSLQTIIDLWQSDQNSLGTQVSRNAFKSHIERMQQFGVDFSAKENPDLITRSFFGKKKRNLIIAAIALPVLTSIFFLGMHYFAATLRPVNSSAKNSKELFKTISKITTKNGSKTNLILPDGTKVWLNAGSSLSYDSSYGKSIREVSLSGEGFFDVVKNREKPFIIHAASINIKVLGTSFNVKSYPTEQTTEASLIRGSIEITFKDRPNKKIILKPKEKIIVNNDSNIEKLQKDEIEKGVSVEGVAIKSLTYEHKTGTIIETSWVENKLIFQDESFQDIAGQLERWYGVSIKFENEQLKENHLTGSFKNETIRQALDALKFTASFNYEIDGNNNVRIF